MSTYLIALFNIAIGAILFAIGLMQLIAWRIN